MRLWEIRFRDGSDLVVEVESTRNLTQELENLPWWRRRWRITKDVVVGISEVSASQPFITKTEARLLIARHNPNHPQKRQRTEVKGFDIGRDK